MPESRTGRSNPCAVRLGIALALLGLLAGCAGQPELSGAAPVDTSSVTVSANYALPANAMMIGPVEGLSCARTAFGRKATSKEATERLKQNAARIGATGIMHMRVAKRGIGPSCWYSFLATGTAYR